MHSGLAVSIGQYSDRGRKEINQDFHGALIPEPPALGLKGIAITVADGISSSAVSGIAAESAIKSFLTDYYCTSDSWTVRTAAQSVIAATNSWLYAQTRHSQHAYDMDKGYVCTFSAMVLKVTTAHLFHVGDSRIYRLSGRGMEQLTTDHTVVLSSQQSYLGRALGSAPDVEIDYRAVPLGVGDVFMLATDGVCEHVDAAVVTGAVAAHAGDLDAAARTIAQAALDRGSDDNLTVQIVRVDCLPAGDAADIMGQAVSLPAPPLLEARQDFDGYRIVRSLHASSRSHIYLAQDSADGSHAVIKIPSIDLREDASYLKRFMLEEWIGRRISSAHVLKNHPQKRPRSSFYLVTEYVDGQTLGQWMADHPRPDLEIVRGIVEQIAKGLRAFHRMEMVHQDLRPENIMIDRDGTVKIIDFGSTKVAGVVEAEPRGAREDILGTVQYTAPEYFVGEPGTPRSDIFSLGVIAYQMLTGKLPYGAQVARTRTRAQQRKLRYAPALESRPDLPPWIDGALRKAVHPDPYKRYEALSEFEFDLRTPNPAFAGNARVPLAERNPLVFWQALSAVLVCVIVFLLARGGS
ncbi:bifunctional protein-serine/threonine kinase/phosphatase [Breoghania sp. L-A4]|uniref:bifunctional protein-serine/threonine kinase/phosphatase n=1 Tax=Breoghania sp. L-A4 TaxID=2304600 RepID=UPI000E3606F7|nr:bifunctional protein-serine/threonine kinase/phosphatase [Breoghania sp. L-A4]AXS40768.1 bifunctional protein-serine/threonine kinase/phosphatase [Breoghania sp. L-A4]